MVVADNETQLHSLGKDKGGWLINEQWTYPFYFNLLARNPTGHRAPNETAITGDQLINWEDPPGNSTQKHQEQQDVS